MDAVMFSAKENNEFAPFDEHSNWPFLSVCACVSVHLVFTGSQRWKLKRNWKKRFQFL